MDGGKVGARPRDCQAPPRIPGPVAPPFPAPERVVPPGSTASNRPPSGRPASLARPAYPPPWPVPPNRRP